MGAPSNIALTILQAAVGKLVPGAEKSAPEGVDQVESNSFANLLEETRAAVTPAELAHGALPSRPRAKPDDKDDKENITAASSLALPPPIAAAIAELPAPAPPVPRKTHAAQFAIETKASATTPATERVSDPTPNSRPTELPPRGGPPAPHTLPDLPPQAALQAQLATRQPPADALSPGKPETAVIRARHVPVESTDPGTRFNPGNAPMTPAAERASNPNPTPSSRPTELPARGGPPAPHVLPDLPPQAALQAQLAARQSPVEYLPLVDPKSPLVPAGKIPAQSTDPAPNLAANDVPMPLSLRAQVASRDAMAANSAQPIIASDAPRAPPTAAQSASAPATTQSQAPLQAPTAIPVHMPVPIPISLPTWFGRSVGNLASLGAESSSSSQASDTAPLEGPDNSAISAPSVPLAEPSVVYPFMPLPMPQPTAGSPVLPQSVDARLSAPTRDEFINGLAERIDWMAARHLTQAEIRVAPQSMGVIDVALQLDGGKVHINFASPHADVRAAIEAGLPGLRDAFQSQGLDLASISVASHGSSGGRSPQAQTQSQPGAQAARAGDETSAHGNAPASNERGMDRGILDEYA